VDLFRPSNLPLTDASIPFFFEPNFDTKVAPLEAARRIQKDPSPKTEKHRSSKQVQKKIYEPVVYGDFLREKVRNNFVHNGGKHNQAFTETVVGELHGW
jgi:hypothetical protein